MARINSFRQVEERYPVLRFVASLFAGIGILLVVLGVFLLVVGLWLYTQSVPGPLSAFGVLAPVAWSFGLFVGGIQFVMLGSVYWLAIHIEENTRITAQALDRLRIDSEPRINLNPPPLFPS
jgi:hypothetical protein